MNGAGSERGQRRRRPGFSDGSGGTAPNAEPPEGGTSFLVKSTPVISLADGARLGAIDRVYLDPVRKAIVGFTFQRGGGLLGGKASGLIEIGDVRAFGPDAVTIDSAAVALSDVAADARADGLIDLNDLLGRQVVTEGGAILGRVAAVRFGQESHRLAALDVAAGTSEPLRAVEAAAIATIGRELIVVSEPAAKPGVVVARPGAEPPRRFYVVEPGGEERRAARTG